MKLTMAIAVGLLLLPRTSLAQEPCTTCLAVSGTALVIGQPVGTRVTTNGMADGSSVSIVLGFAPGATSVSGPAGFTLPLTGPFATIAHGKIINGIWTGSAVVPNDPSIVGLEGYLVAVTQSRTAASVSYLVPFGPIVEDSIQ